MIDYKKLISNGESEYIEFKEKFSDEVIKSLVAFANNKWWQVFLWVKDKWEIIWTDIWKETIQKWINEIKNKTEPEIIPITDIEKIKWKTVIVFSITEYPVKPVVFKWRYYKRVKNSNHIISFQEAMDLHMQSLNTSWDYYPDPNCDLDDLDEEKIKKFIDWLEKRKWRKIDEDPITILKKYDLINKDWKVTFACSILFKEIVPLCNSITLAKFQWTDKMIVKDELLIKDSPIFEVEQVMDFIKKNISKWLIIKPWEVVNTEVWEYPLEAIREIIINAIVHRDYRANPDVQIYIFDDRIEIANPWKFPEEFTIDWLKRWLYKSKPPNKLLASIFKELWIIERFWSWIKRVFERFKIEWYLEPEIDVSWWFITYICKSWRVEDNFKETVEKTVEKIILSIKKDKNITIKELQEVTWLSRRWVEYNIKKLKERWILRRIWPDKWWYWEIVE